MALSLLSPPAVQAVDLALVKAHLRVDGTGEDDLIKSYVDAATAYLEGPFGLTGRALVTQTWRLEVDEWPRGGVLRSPFAPIQSVAVSYLDGAGAYVPLDGALYRLFADRVSVESAPASAGVRFDLTVGYGDRPEDVPAQIRQAILIMVGDMYRLTESVAGGAMQAAPVAASVDNLVRPFRRVML